MSNEERIAIALEKIADALEKQNAGTTTIQIDGFNMADAVMKEASRREKLYQPNPVRDMTVDIQVDKYSALKDVVKGMDIEESIIKNLKVT